MAQAIGIEVVPLASTTPAMEDTSPEMRQCIQNCLECANICDQTLAYCLGQGSEHANAEHIGALRDCEEACTMSASMLARNSPFARRHCALCADVCDTCAESCERLSPGQHPQMEACARACRTCAASCRQMAHPSTTPELLEPP